MKKISIVSAASVLLASSLSFAAAPAADCLNAAVAAGSVSACENVSAVNAPVPVPDWKNPNKTDRQIGPAGSLKRAIHVYNIPLKTAMQFAKLTGKQGGVQAGFIGSFFGTLFGGVGGAVIGAAAAVIAGVVHGAAALGLGIEKGFHKLFG